MRLRIEAVAVGLVVLAVVPYLALKLAWLNGSGVGVDDRTALAELHSTRMVIGNNVTIVLELAAIGLALALASAWGRRVPAWIVLGVGAGATGLLAPILIGLPIGTVLQLAVQGDVRTGGMDDLSPWVFATVYGGFGLMAIGISVLAFRYATARWSTVLDRTPDRPPARAVVAGGLGLVPFGVAMLWWGVSGPGASGPQAMDAVVQRTTLVVTGLLALGGRTLAAVRAEREGLYVPSVPPVRPPGAGPSRVRALTSGPSADPVHPPAHTDDRCADASAPTGGDEDRP